MPRKKFAKELYIEISQEMYDFFKTHPKEFQNIYKSINEKMGAYDDRAFNWKQKAADRWWDMERLRSENKKLREAAGQGIFSHKVNSVYIPKALLFNQYFRGLSLGACLLYSIILDLRLSSLSKGYIDSGSNIFIAEYDLIQTYNEIIFDEFNYRDAIHELEEYGLIYLEQFENWDFRAIYIKVFSIEEGDMIMSKIYADKGYKWLSDV